MALLLVAVLLAFSTFPIHLEAQSEEAFYDSRFPADCASNAIPQSQRQRMKAILRSEFKERVPAIEQIGVLDIQCARDANRRLLGAIVLGYGLVPNPQQIPSSPLKLNNEQFGVFQFDASLSNLRKTITMFPSQRWLDYSVNLEMPSATRLVVNGHGSYGDSRMREEFTVTW